MKWYEVALLALCVATLTLIEAIAAAAFFEGFHYVVSLRPGTALVSLWLSYVWIFAACCCIGWAVAAPFRGRSETRRRIGPIPVLLGAALPLVLAPPAIRPKIGVLLSGPAGLIGLGVSVLLLLGWFAHLVTRQQRRPLQLTIGSLVAVIAILGVADCFILYQLAPQMLSSGGASRLALGSLGAVLLSVPLLAAVRDIDQRSSGTRLGAAFGILVLALVALVHLTPQRSTPPRPVAEGSLDDRPSILLIVVDTLRADFVYRAGSVPDNVPNLRALSEDGVLFERAYATAPWTTASLGSIISSSYPSEHRAGSREAHYGFKSPMADSVSTLAETFVDAGYWTGAALTNPYLGPRFRFDRGFLAYEDLIETHWYHPVFFGAPIQRFMKWQHRAYVPARAQTERVEGMIRRAQATGRPFLVLAHYMDPHIPYDAPELFLSPDSPGGGNPGFRGPHEEAYRNEVSYVDHYLGELFAFLKSEDLYEDLLIVLTSDHGEELYEARDDAQPKARLYDHGHTLHDELIRVPLLVKWPGNLRAGTRSPDLVSLIDVAPTLVEYAGLQWPPGFRGRALSVVPAAPRGDASAVVFAEGLLYGPEQKAAQLGHRKLILGELPRSMEATEAYDLATDPGELSPIPMVEAPESFLMLYELLGAFVGERLPAADSGESVEMDPLLQQQLEALGYTN